jgi:hypothetical protein
MAPMSKSDQAIPAKMREKHDAIMNLIEPFSREHLNDEYLGMCRRLAGLLDPSLKPHMKMKSVDKAFGVSSGTGQAKSKSIRDMLKIRQFDLDWTLPSKMADNPMIWLVQLSNGMIVDARSMPREVQEEAFNRGMIPYIPDQEQDAADDESEI